MSKADSFLPAVVAARSAGVRSSKGDQFLRVHHRSPGVLAVSLPRIRAARSAFKPS